MTYIPIDNMGPDHWSTFAYAETVIVDCQSFQVGFDPRMRQNRRHFRVMKEECPRPKRANPSAYGVPVDLKYSTVLRDGTVEQSHDDWSCIQDLVEAGLMAVKTDTGSISDANYMEPSEHLIITERGYDYILALHKHKANGGTWKTFDPSGV